MRLDRTVQFRHKCPDDVNPKRSRGDDGEFVLDGYGNPSRNPDYADHIRRLYDVPADTEWLALYESSPDEARLGIQHETGQVMAVVSCPDCGAEIVVKTSKE